MAPQGICSESVLHESRIQFTQVVLRLLFTHLLLKRRVVRLQTVKGISLLEVKGEEPWL
jgi:hypothetical protein